MAKTSTKAVARSAASVVKRPASVEIAASGISSGKQCALFLSALIGDVMTGEVTHGAANAATNGVGKLLKVVELQIRYGTRAEDGVRELRLTE